MLINASPSTSPYIPSVLTFTLNEALTLGSGVQLLQARCLQDTAWEIAARSFWHRRLHKCLSY